MKAIKLASIFAVSAVAAAVSTTTMAAEPVFSGSAGLNYYSYESGSDEVGSEGEVNIIGDTGLVYFDLDMESGPDGFDLDEIYVTQGAVQFGDFDGSLIDAAAFSAGVWEDNDDAKYPTDNDLAIRYSVSDELTVAVEAVEGSDEGSLAFSYLTNAGGVDLGVSGAFHDGDNVAVTLGVSAPVGPATVSGFVITGSAAEADVMNYGVGLDLPVTDAVSFAAQYYTLTGESEVDTDYEDAGVFEVAAYYTAGDITYFASMVTFEDDAAEADYTVIGASASF
ncbi:hypothetical protein ACMUMQ_13960 [Marinomonas sp. 2405UD66-6]|uniref:hypothetical protein n=1 Tax=Marinomonas sp. 2405UD66-6 TaxID=3391834 RepID=UPI0039C91081